MDHGSLGQSFSTRVHWRVGASGSADSIPENAVPRRGHHNVWPVIIRHPLSWCWWLGMPPFPAAPCGPWCPAGGGFRPKRRPRSWSRVPGVTEVRWPATDWDWANFIRSINSLMVNLGSDACCPGGPAAAAGGFMIGTWGTNTDWVGRFVPITWKYVPSWSTNVLGFHNTGFMSWTWSWFTRWGPSWSTGGNASPRACRNPRLSSSPGAVATPWWPVQDPRDLPSPGGRVLAEPASSRWQMTPTLPGLSLGLSTGSGVRWGRGGEANNSSSSQLCSGLDPENPLGKSSYPMKSSSERPFSS